MPLQPNKLREQRILVALKESHSKAVSEYQQFLRLALELCEHYGYNIKDIERITGHKL